MNLTTDTSTEAGVLRIAGALDIYGAEPLREALLNQFGGGGDVVVDLGAVETADAAGVQLLLSARRTAAEGARVLRFRNVPAVVGECCRRLGLPDTL